jgi:hypothetical protein
VEKLCGDVESNVFYYDLRCYQYLKNIVGVITIKAKDNVGMRVMEMRDRKPIKDIKTFEGKRPLGKHCPEWEDDIKFVYLLTGEIASQHTALVYSRCLKRRCCFERGNKLQYEKDENL